MWDHEMGAAIARILELMANPPNLRRDGTIKAFDGGRIIEDTGLTEFEFSDGTTAFFGSGVATQLTIRFPSGTEASVTVREAA
jgi:hypothetical protein